MRVENAIELSEWLVGFKQSDNLKQWNSYLETKPVNEKELRIRAYFKTFKIQVNREVASCAGEFILTDIFRVVIRSGDWKINFNYYSNPDEPHRLSLSERIINYAIKHIWEAVDYDL